MISTCHMPDIMLGTLHINYHLVDNYYFTDEEIEA
jgi:hypothetical protein